MKTINLPPGPLSDALEKGILERRPMTITTTNGKTFIVAGHEVDSSNEPLEIKFVKKQ